MYSKACCITVYLDICLIWLCCSIRVDSLRTPEIGTGKSYLMSGDKRDSLGGSLQDGYFWGEGKNVKIRRTREEGGFVKSGELIVELPLRADASRGVVVQKASVHGFSKSRCMGKMVCMNDCCGFLAKFGRRNECGVRKTKVIVCASLAGGVCCGKQMQQAELCDAVKYRVGLNGSVDEEFTAIVYHGDHSAGCRLQCDKKMAKIRSTVEMPEASSVRERISQGARKMMDAVVQGSRGSDALAIELAKDAKEMWSSTGPEMMVSKKNSCERTIKKMSVETVAAELRISGGVLIVPYHKAKDGLCSGPNATVTLHGCCRTRAEWEMVRCNEEYRFSAANLMLACSDNLLVHSLLEQHVVDMMNVPLSFDVQHPNKVAGYFSMGYFAYVPTLSRLMQLAMVMIPATDMYNGLRAKCGDNIEGNSQAKKALDIALSLHLQIAFPEHNWDSFSWKPRIARVSDEGYSGIAGMRSTDGGADVAEASCEFHFKQSLGRLEDSFVDKIFFLHIKTAAMKMINEQIGELFWAEYACLTEYIANLPKAESKGISKICQFLVWHFADKERRERLCVCFKPLGASKSSVAEIGHASQQKLGRKNISLNEAIVLDAAFAQRQVACIKDFLDGNQSHRVRGPDLARTLDLEACASGNLQRKVSMYSSVSALPLTGPPIYGEHSVGQRECSTGVEQLVPTHRPDRNALDTVKHTSVMYSHRPIAALGQRKINGIRYGREFNGRMMFFLDIVGGMDAWVDEKNIDPADVAVWQQRLAYDEMQRSKGVNVDGRERRFRTVLSGDEITGLQVDSTSRTVYCRSIRSAADNMNIARASKLKGEDIIVLSRRGSTDTLMLDGQVGLKVSAIQQRLLYWHAA